VAQPALAEAPDFHLERCAQHGHAKSRHTRRSCNLATAPAMKPRGKNRSSNGTILMPRPGKTVRLLAMRP